MAALNQDPPDPPKRNFAERIFISSDQTRLRAGWRLLLQFLLLILVTVILGGFALATGIDLTAFQDGEVLFVYLLTGAAVIASVYLARRFFDRRSFTSLGLWLHRTALPDLLAGTLVAGFIFALITLILWGAGWLAIEGFAWNTQSWGAILPGIGRMFGLYLMVALAEEIWHRGYLLQNLEDGLNTVSAVALSSLLFSLSHLGNPGASYASVLGILAGGIFLAYAYLRTRALWLPIGVHLGWNFFEGVVFGYPVSGMVMGPHLLSHQVRGPAWITGGSFGPEAGLVLLPGLLVGAWMLNLYARGRSPNAA